MVIPLSVQSKFASVTNSRIASMIFFKTEPCKIFASNMLACVFLNLIVVRVGLVKLKFEF